ncbi:iron-sulfur cluster assembly accessory protein [Colletotrichum graminicola]|uniref:Iron-sulfur cluster assembly accessory protein n=1 Tax=Colletotrichum graminicola (strain M1.001 / M2 / FGSC 10212) TaxID=645133 RepID=E3Q389_COLGM|nr:iron-sulfur cluster assembly accessory protein [Colletotrichum graminicola M1.001]EFQ25068.1 iron-sulfur cluster assembly accessory protein [Colletotrichum graminicola M1.001]WDK15336.1 iron-sulfur cluster assembly accessory protein [Colletotrichum graminicola]
MATTLRCAHAPSSANIFVLLARRTNPTSNHPAPILSVLVPRWRSMTTATRGFSTGRKCCSETFTRRSLPQKYHRRTLQHQTRAFTASAARGQTRCAWNPKKDEDGQEMKLEITDRAGKRLSEIMKKDKNPNLALRIQVESGGCHGFQYLMSLVTLPGGGEAGEEWSKVVGEDDTVFQYLPDNADASCISFEGPKVVIDEPSLELLKGSKVDFTMELIGSQFKITDNPYASSSCGCGTSFDIKI